MAKLSDLDKAIDQLEQEAQILYLAIAKLKEQRGSRSPSPARLTRAKATKEVEPKLVGAVGAGA